MIKWSCLRKLRFKTGYKVAKQKMENQNKQWQSNFVNQEIHDLNHRPESKQVILKTITWYTGVQLGIMGWN